MNWRVLVLAGSLFPLAAWCQPIGFDDEFSSATLNPAWTLVSGCGTFSVTANPGFLRHSLSGCASTIAGAELYRQFTGTDWTFNTSVFYSVPPGPGQNLYLHLIFGSPALINNTEVQLVRHRDDGYGVNDVEYQFIDGGTTLPGGAGFGMGPPPCPSDHCFFRVIRIGQQVTLQLSSDGVTFSTLESQVFTTPLGNLQTVLLVGSSFAASSAYADYDYVRVAPAADVFQVSYAANLNIGDAFVNITNSGASGGNLCANLYTFDPAEELISCCTCTVTPNGLQSLSVVKSLISNPLTPAIPVSVVIKVVATSGTCNAAAAANLAPGLLAWGTTLHQNTSTSAPSYSVTERAFSPSILSDAELTHITSTCGFIQSDGSGFGICGGCAGAGLGASASVQ